MPFRLILDTNVIVSGLLFGGTPRKILELALTGRVELATSPDLLEELERVLLYKFPHARKAILGSLEALQAITLLFIPSERVNAVADDPDDNRVLECAVAAEADFIVSGDKHLLHLEQFHNIPILSPQQFLHLYTSSPKE